MVLTKVSSAALIGIEAREVEIEINEGGATPKIVIVGLPDAAVRESRDRVMTAMGNSGFIQPKGHTTINLAPADLKKEGPSFDLPIALGAIGLRHQYANDASEFFIVGELALDGMVRPVKGCLSIAIEARNQGKRGVIVPMANALESARVTGIDTYGVRTLREAFELLAGEKPLVPVEPEEDHSEDQACYGVDFSEVKGQAHVKRALEVSVAGGHNLLML